MVLRWIAQKISTIQMEDRSRSIVQEITGLDAQSPLVKRHARSIARSNEGSGANEFFCAASTIIEIDRERLRNPKLRTFLKNNNPTIEDLKRLYDKRLESVKDLYARQIEADQGLPKDIYSRLLDEAKQYYAETDPSALHSQKPAEMDD
jgi:hypothetical protein